MAKKKTASSDLSFLEKDAGAPIAFDEVMAMVSRLEKVEEKIEKAEAALKQLQEVRDDLAKNVIPMYLDQHGVTDLTLADGKRLSIKEDLFARLPEDPFVREEALSWLTDHGGGAKIVDEVSIDSPQEELLETLNAKGVPYNRRKTVNGNSLQAFFREGTGLKKGSVALFAIEDVPKYFNLFLKREAKIK